MKKFESNYRLNESDDVLQKENDIHSDLDRRLDAVEQDAESFRAGNRADVDAILKSLDETFARLAGQTQDLLDKTSENLSADAIIESDSRTFMTAARRAAILADALTAAGALVSGLVGSAPVGRQTLSGLSNALDIVNGTALATDASLAALKAGAKSGLDTLAGIATKFDATDSTLSSLAASRVRFDGAQSLTPAQKAQALANLGALAAAQTVENGTGPGQYPNKVKIGWGGVRVRMAVDANDLGAIWTDADVQADYSNSGYHRFPNGLIVQWGRPTLTGAATITFPTAFPNSCFGVVVTPLPASPAAGSIYTVNLAGAPTNTSVSVLCRGMNGASNTASFTGDMYFIAFGH